MGKWVEVARENAFEDGVEVVEYDDEYIAVYKLEDGFYAIDDECTHDAASLAEGEVMEKCVIECPRHGARFDIKTGKNLSLPAVVPVDTYPTKVENGMVMVEVVD
ncbi:MAG: Rieske 2Fe-2S domain-containing protein [Aliifodinibius sp.]|nr:non-heme iron oxygenase ferredoxin subunit [Fodinibius sp.]NIV16704.1 Rieske 2Fe-2S domain-containing protein [Fodinibius sp.]NIY30271.1 Rieske 2Fe-2S domain-containing protein [Fodinibius sp.]